jgi:hypothetical protein
MPPPTILYICGSINQTEQLHAVSKAVGSHVVARFSPYFGDAHVGLARRLGFLEATIAGNKRRGWCLDYLRDHGLEIDEDGRRDDYDLVVTCSDLILPRIARTKPLVAVQEGIFDPDTWTVGALATRALPAHVARGHVVDGREPRLRSVLRRQPRVQGSTRRERRRPRRHLRDGDTQLRRLQDLLRQRLPAPGLRARVHLRRERDVQVGRPRGPS